MEILGANIGETSEGINLKDGSITSITNGVITMSIPEDRVSREKYKGGFDKALEFLLSRRSLSIKGVDSFYISTLGEDIEKDITELPDIRRIVARHPSLIIIIANFTEIVQTKREFFVTKGLFDKKLKFY